MSAMKWVGPGKPMKWAVKKDMPGHLRREAVRVEFRSCIAWIVRDVNGRVLFPGEQWGDTFDFHLRTPGHVIGLRDLTTADSYTWNVEWRAAMHDRIMERLELGAPK